MHNFDFEDLDNYKVLNKVKSPIDLKKMEIDELNVLCGEIRRFILGVVSKNGGHLASNLGVVELTVALHKAFDSPKDRIIWDVGHQCYTHKILTGRFEKFKNLRKEGGISGFPKPCESEHDIAISGHSSISVSLACGFAETELLKKTKNKVIVIIGDGALTGGMAYEGLNNGINLKNLIIILNCNDMSISKTVGSLPQYISRIRARQAYISTNLFIEKFLKRIPFTGNLFAKFLTEFKNVIKKIIYRPNFFSDLGYFFLSPVDGHNLNDLFKALNWAKQQNGPAIVQVFTKKGCGYLQAERYPEKYHGVGTFDLKKGLLNNYEDDCFSNVFGQEICDLAINDEKICVITAAMESGTGLFKFKKKFPNRFFDVGIAESHAVTYAAGLSAGGMVPVFAVYSTFLQRSYDQILHDLAISELHVVFVVDRAGIVEGDGETHQGVFDCAYLTSIPNITIFAPTSYLELKHMLRVALYDIRGVVAVRYSKGRQINFLADCKNFNENFNKSFCVLGNSNVAIVTYGNLTWQAVLARNELIKKNNFEVAVIKMNKLNPIDNEFVYELKKYSEIFFFEEGIKNGGIGEHLFVKLISYDYNGKMFLTAIDGCFVKNLSLNAALKEFNLDYESIVKKIENCSKIFRRN